MLWSPLWERIPVRWGFRPWPSCLVLIIFSHGITWTLGTRAWQSSKKAMLDKDLEEEEEGKWPDDCLSKHDQASCWGGQRRATSWAFAFRDSADCISLEHFLDLTCQRWLLTMVVAPYGKMPIFLMLQACLLQQLESPRGLLVLHPGQRKLS